MINSHYRELASRLKDQIREGIFPPDKPMPSLNAMVIRTGLSKESVRKAYALLLDEGVIDSRPRKGYFVRSAFLSGRPSVLVLLDKFSPHQQAIMEAFSETLGSNADITVKMHYQNPDLLSSALDEGLGRYDWYLVFPHFETGHSMEKALREINRIPTDRLIIMDRLIRDIPKGAGAAYQSIEEDLPAMLMHVIDDLRKYRRIRCMSLSVSLYGDIVAGTIQSFCNDMNLSVDILRDMPEKVEKGDVFIVSGSRLDRRLSELLRKIFSHKLTIGTDVGLICYNDFPLNEFILGGLTTISTDFAKMGSSAAQMIISNSPSREHCPCNLIRRKTF